MLAAHLVPGYLMAAKSQSTWKSEWTGKQRALLWAVALGSTVAPDIDVVRNVLFNGFLNHSVLWTHSIFVYLGLGLLWLTLHNLEYGSFLKTAVGLATVGGFSHLLLDIVAHGTPLLYPVSMMIFGIAPARVVEGGFSAYITDPIFLLEPLFFGLAIIHWAHHRNIAPRFKKLILATTTSGLVLFAVAFILLCTASCQPTSPSPTDDANPLSHAWSATGERSGNHFGYVEEKEPFTEVTKVPNLTGIASAN